MRRRLFIGEIGTLAAALIALAGGASCRRSSRAGLTLAGSTSVQPFAEKWVDAYRAQRPEVSIHVQGGGSTAGVQAALSGAAQIGMSSRALTAAEAARATAILVARDGMAVIVHPHEPRAAISRSAQVAAMLRRATRALAESGRPGRADHASSRARTARGRARPSRSW